MAITGISTQHQDERLVVEELNADDVTASDDLQVGDDANISGDLMVTGNLIMGSQVAPHTITIALAKSTTTDGMDITADTYSGDLTATEGTILVALTAKKAWLVNTNAGAVFKATLVASANPADQYVVAIHPFNGKPIVSAASGTNWEGAGS